MPFLTADPSFALIWSSRLLDAVSLRRIWIVVGSVTVSLCEAITVFGYWPTRVGDSDPASQVRTNFSVKCAECHGAELSRPRGDFGYITAFSSALKGPALASAG